MLLYETKTRDLVQKSKVVLSDETDLGAAGRAHLRLLLLFLGTAVYSTTRS